MTNFCRPKEHSFKSFQLRVDPYCYQFLNLENDANDSIEIFATNRTSKMTRHVSEGKFFPEAFGAFWKIFGFPCCCPIGLTGSFVLFQEPYKSNEKLMVDRIEPIQMPIERAIYI